ncbi:MAG: biotin transporter BioY [Bacillota bacterium]
MNIKNITRIALMGAIISIAAPIAIPLPISPVPLTLGTFALYLAIFILDSKEAFCSTLLYLFLGAVGIPVFSGYTAGFAKFVSPSGGYLIGYLFLVGIGGYFVKRYENRFALQLVGCFLGTIVMYIIGAAWLSQTIGASFIATIPSGILIFLPLDIAKLILAGVVGQKVRARLQFQNVAI